MGRHFKSEWRYYSVSQKQIEGEHERLWRRLANVPIGWKVVHAKSKELFDTHHADLANLIYYYRYERQFSIAIIRRRLSFSEKRLDFIIGQYPWWPGCG